jgi:hypothetical protein
MSRKHGTGNEDTFKDESNRLTIIYSDYGRSILVGLRSIAWLV